MQTILLVGYIVGFIITCGILCAAWSIDMQPLQVFAALVWPIYVPVVLVMLYTKRYITAREEREKLLREIESEL